MSLRLRFQGGPRAGETLNFGDEYQSITVGRDPEKCQVVFPPNETTVGREHCTLQRTAGRYRLILNGENVVLVNGKPAYHEQVLEDSADVRFGRNGPQAIIETIGNAALPETVNRERQAGVGTVMENLGRSTSTTRKATIAALIAVPLLAIIGYIAYRGTQQKEVALNESVQKMSQASAASVADVLGQVSAVKAELLTKESSMAPVLNSVRGSVYLVFGQLPGRAEDTIGTAWVAAPGILGTCAHVAKEFDALAQAGAKMYVRSTGPDPKTFEIASATPHPGFQAFQNIWQQYLPIVAPSENSVQLVQISPGCDVGLLVVKDPTGLAPPLPIAPDSVLKSLKSGDTVGFVGFPMENMMAGGVNAKFPDPTSQSGHIIAMEDDFLVADPNGQLIRDSLPAVGGASGSPIFNVDGQVIGVLSSGNYLENQEGKRVDVGSGQTYAQRADLVRELLDKTADSIMPDRVAQWQKEMSQFESGSKDLPGIITKQLVDAFQQDAGGRPVAQMDDTLTSKVTKGDPNNPPSAIVPVDLPAAGKYLFIVMSPKFNDLQMFLATADDKKQLTDPTDADWYGSATADADGAATIHVVVSGSDDGDPFTLAVYQAKPGIGTLLQSISGGNGNGNGGNNGNGGGQ